METTTMSGEKKEKTKSNTVTYKTVRKYSIWRVYMCHFSRKEKEFIYFHFFAGDYI